MHAHVLVYVPETNLQFIGYCILQGVLNTQFSAVLINAGYIYMLYHSLHWLSNWLKLVTCYLVYS